MPASSGAPFAPVTAFARPVAGTTGVPEQPAGGGVRLDGVPVQSIGDLQRLLSGERVGRRLVAGIARGGDLLDLPLVPREL